MKITIVYAIALFILFVGCRTDSGFITQEEGRIIYELPSNLDTSNVLIDVDEPPEPLGLPIGISYPDAAKRAGIQGTVYLECIIDTNGDVIYIKILQGIGYGCDEAAVKAVRTTKFSPGKHKGEIVIVKLIFPVHFRLRR